MKSKRWKSLHPRHDWLWYCGWKVMDHTPYSHYVVPRDSHLFGSLKRQASGWHVICSRCQCEANCHLLDTHYTVILSALGYKPWCHGGTNAYMPVQYVPCASHVSCVQQSENKVLGFKVLVTFFFCKFLCVFLQPVSFRHNLAIWHNYHSSATHNYHSSATHNYHSSATHNYHSSATHNYHVYKFCHAQLPQFCHTIFSSDTICSKYGSDVKP